jgi:hypothetical protein
MVYEYPYLAWNCDQNKDVPVGGGGGGGGGGDR